MPHKKHHHKRHPSLEHDAMPGELKRTKNFYGNTNTLFKEKPCSDQQSQEVNVNVTVNEKQDDCFVAMIKACCAKK